MIDPAYLSDERDLDALVAGLIRARDIAAATPLRTWLSAELVPGSAVRNTGHLREHLRATASSFFHPVGTCRMGDDDAAVVDATLRVKGVAGLRVADASVMPRTTSANTHAPTVMIATRAADFILSSLSAPADVATI